MRRAVQVTAGTGPVEVRRFVGELVPALERAMTLRGVVVTDVGWVGAAHAPRSACLGVGVSDAAALSDLLGTHLLVSAERGRRARKRWYAGVSLVCLPARGLPVVDLGAVTVTACRASGPGGQHVNTTDSAVRVLHHPTGLTVKAQGHRSRRQNEKAALVRLRELLAEREAAVSQDSRRGAWRAHHTLVRGRPVATWERGRDGALVRVQR